MDNIKISVTFELPGSTMMTSQECEKNPNENYLKTVVTIPYSKRQGKKIVTKKEYLNVLIRKCYPSKQVINMTTEAYESILDTPTVGTSVGHWKRMSKHQKINAHLKNIQHDLKATGFTYNILND